MADTAPETKAAETPAPAPAVDPAPAPAPTTEAAPAPTPEPASLINEAAPKEAPKPAEAAKSDPQTEAQKAAEEAKPAEAPSLIDASKPIEYNFTFPEGITAENLPGLKNYTALAQELKLSPEAGQKILDLYLKEVQSIPATIERAQAEAWNQTQKAWQDAVKADPEIGGNRMQTVLQQCNGLIKEYGGTADEQKALRSALNITGAGNHPAVVRFLSRVAKGLAEPPPVPATDAKPAPSQARSRAERRYSPNGAQPSTGT